MFELNYHDLKNIESLLNEICYKNRDNENEQNSFVSHIIPDISIKNYIKRIIKYFKCSDSCIILGLIYVQMFCDNFNLKLNKHLIHKLILTGCVISSKFIEDDHYSNYFYSKVGGIDLKELNSLEIEMLKGLEYRLYIDESVFDNFVYIFTKRYMNEDDVLKSVHLTKDFVPVGLPTSPKEE
jgi:hypothetical protein